jgi:putative hydrolases of HD superfamily
MHSAENLKNELRHSFKSSGLQESVAEHSWRLCLMALILSDKVENIDKNKCLRMALVHDLCEVFAGDINRLDLSKQKGKYTREKESIEKLIKLLPNDIAKEILELWLEFEEGNTPETKFVKLIDSLEVLIQHNEADINTWSETEKSLHYGLAKQHAEKYGFLCDFASEIDKETHDKLMKAGYKPKQLEREQYEKYFGSSRSVPSHKSI